MSVVFAPPLPWLAILALGVLGAVLAAMGTWRRARGTAFRTGVMSVLLIALANPQIAEQERRPLDDVALVVIDESPSMDVGNRAAQAEQALKQIEARLAGRKNLTVKIQRAGRGTHHATADGTALLGDVADALDEIPATRRAGVFLITDGQVHDIEAKTGLAHDIPVHVMLAGVEGGRDRRIEIHDAPKYGIVDQHVPVEIQIHDEAARIPIPVTVRLDGVEVLRRALRAGARLRLSVPLHHAGANVIEIDVPPVAGEITDINNRSVLTVNGVRERLRVLLVSGEPHPGERAWRDLLKSDPAVELGHFTILRAPDRLDATPVEELALIAFPVRQLFQERLKHFDLIIFDRFRRRGVLPGVYLRNIAEYVRNGGAVLVAAGPAFATPKGIHATAIGDLLPALPTGKTHQGPFTPRVTAPGHRHPISAGLPGDAEPKPRWGRWFRRIEVARNGAASAGTPLLATPDGAPLLLVDRVGDGRAALLLSDQIWLWSRGFEGGGPFAPLMRRLAHWLMKEPELEEERLTGAVRDGRLAVARQSAAGEFKPVTVTGPTGRTQRLPLTKTGDGLAEANAELSGPGVYRLDDGVISTRVAIGRLNPREFADMRSSPDPLAETVRRHDGGIFRIADRVPDIRDIRPGRTAHGSNWAGIARHGAGVVTGLHTVPLLPAVIVMVLALALLVLAWRRESR